MVDSTGLQNLTRFDKIVNEDGTPTEFFQRLLQGKTFLITTKVSGPGLSIDHAIARWSGTEGNELESSSAILDDDGRLSVTVGPYVPGGKSFKVSNTGSGLGTLFSVRDDGRFDWNEDSYGAYFSWDTNLAYISTNAITPQLDIRINETNVATITAGLIAVDGNVTVDDEAYGGGWNGSLEVPTKNALWDKIETISGGGSAWWFSPPSAASFTLLNSGVGDLVLTDDADAGLTISAPTFNGSLNHSIAYQTPPAASDWVATMRMEGTALTAEYSGLGMIIRAAAGQAYMFGVRRYGTAISAMNNRWNSLTSFNSDLYAVLSTPFADLPWRRVSFNNGTGLLTFQVSVDGKNWYTVVTENISVLFGGPPATQVGIFMGSNQSSSAILATVGNWSIV